MVCLNFSPTEIFRKNFVLSLETERECQNSHGEEFRREISGFPVSHTVTKPSNETRGTISKSQKFPSQ